MASSKRFLGQCQLGRVLVREPKCWVSNSQSQFVLIHCFPKVLHVLQRTVSGSYEVSRRWKFSGEIVSVCCCFGRVLVSLSTGEVLALESPGITGEPPSIGVPVGTGSTTAVGTAVELPGKKRKFLENRDSGELNPSKKRKKETDEESQDGQKIGPDVRMKPFLKDKADLLFMLPFPLGILAVFPQRLCVYNDSGKTTLEISTPLSVKRLSTDLTITCTSYCSRERATNNTDEQPRGIQRNEVDNSLASQVTEQLYDCLFGKSTNSHASIMAVIGDKRGNVFFSPISKKNTVSQLLKFEGESVQNILFVRLPNDSEPTDKMLSNNIPSPKKNALILVGSSGKIFVLIADKPGTSCGFVKHELNIEDRISHSIFLDDSSCLVYSNHAGQLYAVTFFHTPGTEKAFHSSPVPLPLCDGILSFCTGFEKNQLIALRSDGRVLWYSIPPEIFSRNSDRPLSSADVSLATEIAKTSLGRLSAISQKQDSLAATCTTLSRQLSRVNMVIHVAQDMYTSTSGPAKRPLFKCALIPFVTDFPSATGRTWIRSVLEYSPHNGRREFDAHWSFVLRVYFTGEEGFTASYPLASICVGSPIPTPTVPVPHSTCWRWIVETPVAIKSEAPVHVRAYLCYQMSTVPTTKNSEAYTPQALFFALTDEIHLSCLDFVSCVDRQQSKLRNFPVPKKHNTPKAELRHLINSWNKEKLPPGSSIQNSRLSSFAIRVGPPLTLFSQPDPASSLESTSTASGTNANTTNSSTSTVAVTDPSTSKPSLFLEKLLTMLFLPVIVDHHKQLSVSGMVKRCLQVTSGDDGDTTGDLALYTCSGELIQLKLALRSDIVNANLQQHQHDIVRRVGAVLDAKEEEKQRYPILEITCQSSDSGSKKPAAALIPLVRASLLLHIKHVFALFTHEWSKNLSNPAKEISSDSQLVLLRSLNKSIRGAKSGIEQHSISLRIRRVQDSITQFSHKIDSFKNRSRSWVPFKEEIRKIFLELIQIYLEQREVVDKFFTF